MSWILWAMLTGCPTKVPVTGAVNDGGSNATRPAPVAGAVNDGRFRDNRYGWEMPIPEGWVARPGPEAGLMRLAVERVASDVRVEIWVFPGDGDLSARHREGCFWSYQDTGRFTALGGDGPIHAATCVPHDPSEPRIFATITRRQGKILQVEVHAPPDRLVAAKEAGDALTRGLIW